MVTEVHNSKDASRSLRNGSAHTVDRFRNGSVDLADETSESDNESLSSCATPRPLGDPLFSGSATPRAAPLPERSYRLRGVNEGEGMAKELARFSTYVGKYAPAFRQLPALLKPGPRHFLPAIGEVDALLKIDRPDGEDDGAGTEELDEPALQQSDPAALRLEFGALRPLRNSAGLQDMEVGCIEDEGESRRIQIDRWIRTVQRLRDQYPNTESPWASDEHAPDFEQLVREWPDELASLFLPHPSRLALEETHMSLAQLLKLGCALLDVPTRPNELNKALHALWMLYFELRNRERITST